jgi:CRP/FNR family transcriptional regulator
MAKLPQLRDISLFKSLNEENFKRLELICKTKFFPKGKTIFYKDDPGTELYIVLHGRVKGIMTGDNGEEIILTTFKPYDIFGEMNLFDNKGRSLTVVADPEATLGIIRKNDFFNFLLKNPELSVEIIKMLIERLRKTDEIIENITFLNVKERTLQLLKNIANEKGKIENNLIKFPKLTHQEIASRVASSRESITKCLKSLQQHGILEADDEYFYLKNEK